MIYALTDDIHFPAPHPTDRQGSIAVGGDLSPERLVEAYSNGIFPLSAFREEILTWCCPMDRFVIFPDEVHVSHSMRNVINKGEYRITYNEAFDKVINSCCQLHINERYAWIGPDIVEAYTKLNRMDKAHSVEVWQGDKLAGGLYGVVLKNAFFGESMCTFEPNASKLALIYLAEKMKKEGGKFIDCQYETEHLLTMGGRHITFKQYMAILNNGQ